VYWCYCCICLCILIESFVVSHVFCLRQFVRFVGKTLTTAMEFYVNRIVGTSTTFLVCKMFETTHTSPFERNVLNVVPNTTSWFSGWRLMAFPVVSKMKKKKHISTFVVAFCSCPNKSVCSASCFARGHLFWVQVPARNYTVVFF
jgi:hypothetical protein